MDIYKEYELVRAEKICKYNVKERKSLPKIFIVVPYHVLDVVGGGQKALSNLANLLSESNYDVRVIFESYKRENNYLQKFVFNLSYWRNMAWGELDIYYMGYISWDWNSNKSCL